MSKIKSIVEKEGGKNAHSENQYGWSNQPEVVVFNAREEDIETIKQALQKGMGTEWIIISEKDWKMKKMATGGKITAKDEGNWFDSSRGRYIGEAVIETAEHFGFKIKPEDEVNKKADGEEYEDLWIEAEEYLNTLAPEGYYFGSQPDTSDWGLWKSEDMEMGIGGFVLGAAAGFVAGKKLDLGWNPHKVKFAAGGSIPEKRIDTVLHHYIMAALWSSTDDEDQPLDANYGSEDIAPDTLALMRRDVTKFMEDNLELIKKSEMSDEQLGHDFWLTRNHHGAGFWDRALPDNTADELTEAAQKFKEVSLYVGDDGKIYGEGMAQGGTTPTSNFSDYYANNGALIFGSYFTPQMADGGCMACGGKMAAGGSVGKISPSMQKQIDDLPSGWNSDFAILLSKISAKEQREIMRGIGISAQEAYRTHPTELKYDLAAQVYIELKKRRFGYKENGGKMAAGGMIDWKKDLKPTDKVIKKTSNGIESFVTEDGKMITWSLNDASIARNDLENRSVKIATGGEVKSKAITIINEIERRLKEAENSSYNKKTIYPFSPIKYTIHKNAYEKMWSGNIPSITVEAKETDGTTGGSTFKLRMYDPHYASWELEYKNLAYDIKEKGIRFKNYDEFIKHIKCFLDKTDFFQNFPLHDIASWRWKTKK